MAAKKNTLEKVLHLAGEFVTKHGGQWGHSEWESFLKKADKAGADIDDEGKRNLGNMLEAAKSLYQRAGIVPGTKPAKSKSKTKPKAKAKTKTQKTAKKKTAAKKKAVAKN